MEQVRDPVCGRMIDPKAATAKMTDGANEVYFALTNAAGHSRRSGTSRPTPSLVT